MLPPPASASSLASVPTTRESKEPPVAQTAKANAALSFDSDTNETSERGDDESDTSSNDDDDAETAKVDPS